MCLPDRVPNTSEVRPLPRSTEPINCDVVVFPFVPVTPNVSSWSQGWPNTEADTQPVAARTSVVRICATASGNG